MTNTEKLNNLIVILENIKITDKDDFTKVIKKATSDAMKANPNAIYRKKRVYTVNPYIEFVKAKMLEMTDYPNGKKLKEIRHMWQIHKAFRDLVE